jgi:hypothetical protein
VKATALLLPPLPDQRINGSAVDGAPTEEPRPDASNARSQRPAPRAIGVSRALACVLNTRGCPQVFYTAPVIHPVRVHIFSWQTRNKLMRHGVDTLPRVRYMLKKAWSLLGARRQNLSRLRVEKPGCAGSRQIIPAAGLVALGLFVHPQWLVQWRRQTHAGAPIYTLSQPLPLLTKGVIAGIDNRRCARGTADRLPRLTLAHNRRLYSPTHYSRALDALGNIFIHPFLRCVTALYLLKGHR